MLRKNVMKNKRKLLIWILITALMLSGCGSERNNGVDGEKSDDSLIVKIMEAIFGDGNMQSSGDEEIKLPTPTPEGENPGDPTPTEMAGEDDVTPTPTEEVEVTPEPTEEPEVTETPTPIPTEEPEATPTPEPTEIPVATPTVAPTKAPTATPTKAPIATPTKKATPTPTKKATPTPTKKATPTPTRKVTPTPTKAPTATPTKAPTNTPTPSPSPIPANSLVAVTVGGKTIVVGDTASRLTSVMGNPSRKDEADGNFQYYVYNSSSSNFAMVAVSKSTSKVVGFFVCSKSLKYAGLDSNTTVSSFRRKYSNATVLDYIGARQVKDTDGRATFYFDTNNDDSLYAVSYMSNSISWSNLTTTSSTAVEKEIVDITNAYRARYGVSKLSWNDNVSKIARNYSKRMGDENFFGHESPDGLKLKDRMGSVPNKACTENLNGNLMQKGHGSAHLSSSIMNVCSWITSSGYRQNMLNAGYTHAGAGVAGGYTSSKYSDYATLIFYTPN